MSGAGRLSSLAKSYNVKIPGHLELQIDVENYLANGGEYKDVTQKNPSIIGPADRRVVDR